MTRRFFKVLPLLAVAGLLAACNPQPNSGQNGYNAMNGTAAPAAGTVIVTVNGDPITAAELDAYVSLRTHGARIQLNDMQRYQIAKQLIQLTLAYQSAREQNLASDPEVRAGLALQQKLYLANQAVEHYMATATVPESRLQSEYQKLVAAQSGEQYKARHILVKDKSKAEQIIKKLDNGADFATLAKKESIDKGTASQGGELGWFKPKQMVPEFSAAIAKLKPGQYTETPVKSRYGWHVILLEDERTSAPPSYTASKPTLARQAKSSMLREHFDKLHSQASIDWMIPNPASAAAAARMKAVKEAAAKAAAAKTAAPPASASAPASTPAPATN
ncbi:MAG: peptidylprolyl isomerase [Gammaproteobacteria bacterium]|nr:peptidylprolyl isomerase [Gammaproteobacteria bacterium]